MVEQAFHVLRPDGVFVVLSPYEKDEFFPPLLKKVFGRVHSADGGRRHACCWCHREGDRPRRRHEMTFQVRSTTGLVRFVSRPGTFSYGRFDDGRGRWSRGGDRAGRPRAGPGLRLRHQRRLRGAPRRAGGHITFVDSNLRAVALAEHNARERTG